MCPQYTDAPAFGTSIKLCKLCQISLWHHGVTLDTFLVNKESKKKKKKKKKNENYKAFRLQGQ